MRMDLRVQHGGTRKHGEPESDRGVGRNGGGDPHAGEQGTGQVDDCALTDACARAWVARVGPCARWRAERAKAGAVARPRTALTVWRFGGLAVLAAWSFWRRAQQRMTPIDDGGEEGPSQTHLGAVHTPPLCQAREVLAFPMHQLFVKISRPRLQSRLMRDLIKCN